MYKIFLAIFWVINSRLHALKSKRKQKNLKTYNLRRFSLKKPRFYPALDLIHSNHCIETERFRDSGEHQVAQEQSVVSHKRYVCNISDEDDNLTVVLF